MRAIKLFNWIYCSILLAFRAMYGWEGQGILNDLVLPTPSWIGASGVMWVALLATLTLRLIRPRGAESEWLSEAFVEVMAFGINVVVAVHSANFWAVFVVLGSAQCGESVLAGVRSHLLKGIKHALRKKGGRRVAPDINVLKE